MDYSPQRCMALLTELENLGMTDHIFSRLHHFRNVNFRKETPTIAGMQQYCRGKPSFRRGENNERLVERMEFVLRECQGKAANSTLTELAEMAFQKIPVMPTWKQ